jgi:hypothetical protein
MNLIYWFSWHPDADDRYAISDKAAAQYMDDVCKEMVRKNFDNMDSVYLHVSDMDSSHDTDLVITVCSPLMPVCGIDARAMAGIKMSIFTDYREEIIKICHKVLVLCIKSVVENNVRGMITEYCGQSDGFLTPSDITDAYRMACSDVDDELANFRDMIN